LVKIIKKKKTNPIPVDITVTFKIIDELKTIYDKEAPIYEIFGKEIRFSKLADFFMSQLKKWIRDNHSKVSKILDRIELHLSLRKALKKKG